MTALTEHHPTPHCLHDTGWAAVQAPEAFLDQPQLDFLASVPATCQIELLYRIAPRLPRNFYGKHLPQSKQALHK